jgi:hypothetical protein
VRRTTVKFRPPMLAMLLLTGACSSPPPDPEAAAFDDGPSVDPLVRFYDAPLSSVWAAAEEALVEEGVVLSRRRRGANRGVLVGHGGLDLRVKVRVRSQTAERTEAGVEILPRNTALAEMIQDRIGDKLSLGRAKAALFGETSLERTYRDDLSACMAAAEGACRALNLDVVHKHLAESRGRLEARDGSGRSARFTMRSTGGPSRRTEAVLTTDAAGDGGEKEFLLRIAREFERDLVRAEE